MALKEIGIDVENGDSVDGKSVTERMVPAIRRFSNEHQSVEVFLHGDQDKIQDAFGGDVPVQAVVVPASEFYTPDCVLTRRLKGSVLNNLVGSIRDGSIEGMYTIGDTSKLAFEASKMRIREVGKQALVAVFPSRKKDFVFSDIGFTSQTSKKEKYSDVVDEWARGIYGQGIMSSVYIKGMGIERPRWGVLSIGTEDHKGSDVDKRLEELVCQGISERGLGEFMEYVGKVEPKDCFDGRVDVVLTDGYKGNLSLKWMEASFEILEHWVKGEFDKFSWRDKVRLALGSGVLKEVKRNLLDKANPDRYSGAIVLGYEGVVVKGHGASGSDAIYYGLCRLADCNSEDSGKKLAAVIKKYMSE